MTNPHSTAPRPGAAPARARATWLPRVLFESALIVLSVLLALALDEWRQRRARTRHIENVLVSIAEELRENRSAVERSREHHLSMRDSLLSYEARDEPPPPSIYLGGLLNTALVHSTAWEAAHRTGATTEIPWDLVLALSRAYSRQIKYQELGETMTQDVMLDIRREGIDQVLRERASSFIPIQLDFANREASLREMYTEVLALMERDRP